ncbi:MAG TPA: proline racemase family protein [Thermoplasmata archaeon]|nr:proline racemase family protein [Thermoplasmata archaeon]
MAVGRVRVVDSHTEGEPTRVVVDGGPELGTGPLAERLERFRRDHDGFRRAVLAEPRGSATMVGALLAPPSAPGPAAATIFFNDVGYLGMCGHGTIGLVETLAHLGRLGPGRLSIETPVGVVGAERLTDGRVTFWNVESYRTQRAVSVDVPDFGRVTGDVAWGGNWFFLTGAAPRPLRPEEAGALTHYCLAVRQALGAAGVTGDAGAAIEHIELCGPPQRPENDARNFVLCPGDAYDRSPCGTGTSARLACLVADGVLDEGAPWRQEGILGTVFEGRARRHGAGIIPAITGRAFVTAEAELRFDPDDPFREGRAP